MENRHLICVDDLGAEGIVELLSLTRRFAEVAQRPIPRVPALRGKTVVTVFFESSTRTRLSFETAAKRLSAETLSFSAQSSSVEKGESLRDTVETIDAMGVDAMVVRHKSAGAPRRIASWVTASVINAGDGQHEHPTQALTDCFTLLEAIGDAKRLEHGDLGGLSVAFVGDIRHSRVARSTSRAFGLLGADVTLVAPSTLLPPSLEGWDVEVSHDLDAVLGRTDVVYLLRLQTERMGEGFFPSLHEYSTRFAMTRERASRLHAEAFVMHPGPMNRGVEIEAEVASAANALVTRQVRNGVAVRMAVLFALLAAPGAFDSVAALPLAQNEESAAAVSTVKRSA